MIGQTNFERIIGGTNEDKEKAAEVLQDIFDGDYKKLADNQIEKSPEDLEILKTAESLVDDIIVQYN